MDDSGQVAEGTAVADAPQRLSDTAPAAAALSSELPHFLKGVRVLLAEGNFEEAEAILKDRILRYPADLETSASFAVAAAGRKNWPEAAARWEATLARFPGIRSFHGVASSALAEAGLGARADTLLDVCLADDPNSVEFQVLYAEAAHKTERWVLAAERWEKLMQIDPGNLVYRQLRGDALWQADLVRGADDAPVAGQARPPAGESKAPLRTQGPADEDEIRSLFESFESLGDNCEFGLLQRRVGVEPATLYRFSAITPERMVTVLDLGLAPLGDPEHTTVEISGEEYLVGDRRGYFSMHTFILVSQSDPAALLKRQQARITILKRKMLFQLARADRIFIIKDTLARISDGTLRRVSASLRRYGPNRLLGMRHADLAHPPGTIERVDDDILVGYVDTMFGCRLERSDYESWVQVLRQANAATSPW